MDRTIREDVGRAVKVGLTVFDSDGSKVGFVDETDKTHGWMVVRTGAFDQKKLWVPYRLVKSVDERELFVSMLTGGLEAQFSKPPVRRTRVEQRDGKTIATTTEASGFDEEPVSVSEVDLDVIKRLLAAGQRVWTSDDVEVGAISDFDQDGRYVVLKTGHLASQHSLLVPIALFVDVDREASEATLAVSQADLENMKHQQPAESIIELQSPVDY